MPVPVPIALGRPAQVYPFDRSVSRWLDGEVLSRTPGPDEVALAEDLASFLVALRSVPAAGGPPAGPLTAWRDAPLEVYADEARRAFGSLDRAEATAAGRAARC